jgi:hypothetical protein
MRVPLLEYRIRFVLAFEPGDQPSRLSSAMFRVVSNGPIRRTRAGWESIALIEKWATPRADPLRLLLCIAVARSRG